MNKEKDLIGLAGEYAVASELCRRGVYAQLTLGKHKQTDILVETEYTMLRIQVKTKQGEVWPAVKGIYRDDDILVLVDLKSKNLNERPDFYVSDISDWKKLIEKEKIRSPSIKVDGRLRIEYPDGWKGLNIKLKDIQTHKERWDKIIQRVERGKANSNT